MSIKDKVKKYKCKYCKEYYKMSMRFYGIRSMSIFKKCCNNKECIDEALEVSKQNKYEKQKREWKKRKENLKVEIGTRKKAHEEPLQKTINKIAVLIDKDHPCIARPIENHVRFDGGHVYSVGSHPSLRYNLNNIFKQSVKSNRDLGGEQVLMLEGIEILHGQDQRKTTEGLIQKYPILKLTYDEKKEALKRANQLKRDIEKGLKVTRDECNLIIGIYK